MPHLIGSTVMLREYRESDFTEVRAWVNDPEATSQLSPVFDRVHTVAMTRAYFDDVMAGKGTIHAFIIADARDERYLGQTDLRLGSDPSHQAELAIWIPDPANRGRGFGGEALRLLLDYGFDRLNLHRIFLRVYTRNERAVGLYRSLGFVEEGVLRDDAFRDGRYLDMMVMGLLDREWRVRSRQELATPERTLPSAPTCP